MRRGDSAESRDHGQRTRWRAKKSDLPQSGDQAAPELAKWKDAQQNIYAHFTLTCDGPASTTVQSERFVWALNPTRTDTPSPSTITNNDKNSDGHDKNINCDKTNTASKNMPNPHRLGAEPHDASPDAKKKAKNIKLEISARPRSSWAWKLSETVQKEL